MEIQLSLFSTPDPPPKHSKSKRPSTKPKPDPLIFVPFGLGGIDDTTLLQPERGLGINAVLEDRLPAIRVYDATRFGFHVIDDKQFKFFHFQSLRPILGIYSADEIWSLYTIFWNRTNLPMWKTARVAHSFWKIEELKAFLLENSLKERELKPAHKNTLWCGGEITDIINSVIAPDYVEPKQFSQHEPMRKIYDEDDDEDDD